MELIEKVYEWNAAYRDLAKEVRLKDLPEEAYEAVVVDALMDIADSWQQALEIFQHEKNEGGWMCGDVAAFIKRKCGETSQTDKLLDGHLGREISAIMLKTAKELTADLKVLWPVRETYEDQPQWEVEFPDGTRNYMTEENIRHEGYVGDLPSLDRLLSGKGTTHDLAKMLLGAPETPIDQKDDEDPHHVLWTTSLDSDLVAVHWSNENGYIQIGINNHIK